MPETITNPPEPIPLDSSLPLEERLLKRSIKLQQADQANLLADRWAGLAMNRESVSQYHQQTHRATEALTNQWINQHSDGAAMPAEDDQTVNTDLSERYEQHTHYHQYPSAPAAAAPVAQAAQASSVPAAVAASAAPSVLAKALPYVLASGGTSLATAGVMAGAAWLGGLFGDNAPTPAGSDVNHKFESEYEVRFFDADGNPISVPHISTLETDQ